MSIVFDAQKIPETRRGFKLSDIPSAWFVVMGLFLLFFIWRMWPMAQFPVSAFNYLVPFEDKRNIASKVENPCDIKPTCVVVYLAPWCPASRAMIEQIPSFREFSKGSDRPGILVIVGAGKKEDSAQMALRVGGPIFIDPDRQFEKTTKVSHYPYFIVIDPKKRIAARGHDVYYWLRNEMRSH